MVNLFQYPFSLNPDGSVATVPDGEDAYTQELANLILTSPGERPLAPDYGIEDPVFSELNTVELLGKIEMFGPPVTVADDGVTTTYPKDGIAQVEIDFSVTESEDDSELSYLDTTEDDYYDTTDTGVDTYGFQDRTD